MARVATVYFVSWYLHNKDNDGWAYKVENRYNDKSAAEKAYYTLLGNFIGGSTYDLVTAILSDSDGRVWQSRTWPDDTEDIVVKPDYEPNIV